MISSRTRLALKAAKERGVVLGSPRLPEINATQQAASAARAEGIRGEIEQLAGLSARAAAQTLNEKGVPTATGAPWYAQTVIRVRERLAA